VRQCIVNSGVAATLHVLAEVYRAGRRSFPLRDDFSASQTVSLRIDQLKEHSAEAISKAVREHGEVWVLNKRNELEGVIERRPKAFLETPEAASCTLLNFD